MGKFNKESNLRNSETQSVTLCRGLWRQEIIGHANQVSESTKQLYRLCFGKTLISSATPRYKASCENTVACSSPVASSATRPPYPTPPPLPKISPKLGLGFSFELGKKKKRNYDIWEKTRLPSSKCVEISQGLVIVHRETEQWMKWI